MSYKHICISFVLFAFCLTGALAQTLNADLKAANLAIANARELSMEIQYNFYCSCKQSVVSESKTSTMAKKESSYYTVNGTSEMVTIGTLQLSINNTQKQIVLMKSTNVGISEISKKIEGLLKIAKRTEYKLVGNEKIYTLVINEYGLSEIEIRIQKSNSMISRIVFFQSETIQAEVKGKKATCKQPKTEIVFRNIRLNVTQNPAKFRMNTYVEKRKDGTYQPVGAYKEYQLIDRTRN